MSKIEYRVRAVTRYVVTKHRVRDDGSATTGECLETQSAENANRAAEALAAAEPMGAVAFAFEGPPPGRAMRAKVVLTEKRPNAYLRSGPDVPGRKETRTNDQGREYTWADPTDPLNVAADGWHVRFAAVWGGADPADQGNAARENRIFAHATPCLNFDAVIRNEEVVERLHLGSEFYVDFIPAVKAA